jgi:hypothetical protein
MAEMIIPGTYIDVRAEGLISAARIATGIVGVVGTASSGPIGQPVTLAGFSSARDTFGVPDDFKQPEDGANPLTLVRALQLIYGNGASTVVAVRVASSTAASANAALLAEGGEKVVTLTGVTPGTWANDMQVLVEPAADDCRIQGEVITTGFNKLRYSPIVPSAENQIRLQRGVTRTTRTLQLVTTRIVKNESVAANAQSRFFLSSTPVVNVAAVTEVRVLDTATGNVVRTFRDPHILYGAGAPPPAGDVRITTDTGELIFEASQLPAAGQKVEVTYAVGHAPPQSGEVLLTVWDGTLTFPSGEAPVQADGDRLIANYVVDRAVCVQVRLTAGTIVERYLSPDGVGLAGAINAASQLATAAADPTNGNRRPKTVSAFFGTGANVAGNNGANASPDDYATGLEALSNMIINIVHLAGMDSATAGDKLAAHLNATAETDHERIGVIGAPGSKVADFKSHTLASDRIVVVAPGLKIPNGPALPPAFAAAAITGVISAAEPETSLTNKAVTIPGLALALNRGEQEQLIQRNVLTLIDREGFRVVKGVTSAGEGTPFSSIPIRRIVDFAKYGVRSGANSYLGRLNNPRVRGALKATLDGFLTRMVQDEMLTGYALEVTATRAQEIAGEVSVEMTLQPTFSIDFIRVTMNLK